MKPKIKFIMIVLLGLLVLIGVIVIMVNPLFKSEERTKKDILKLIPLGMSLEDAVKVFEKKDNWKIGSSKGYRSWSPDDSERVLNDSRSTRILDFVLAKFAFVTVEAIFTFDGEGLDMKLTDVRVWKPVSP